MQRVLFSFFNLLFARNAYAYANLRSHLDRVMPGHTFYFPKRSAFHDQPHPLAAFDDMRTHPLVWLSMLWDRFAEYCDAEVLPAFDRGQTVILDGCGFDALLTTSIAAWEQRGELAEFHHQRVQDVLIRRGIPAPTYFHLWTDAGSEFERFCRADPGTQVSKAEFDDYYRKAGIIRSEYFAEGTGQRPPYCIEEALSSFGVMSVVTKRLQETLLVSEAA